MSTDHLQPTYEELLAREAARNAMSQYEQTVHSQPVPPVQPVNQVPHHSAHAPQYTVPNPGHVPEAMHTVAQQAVANTDADSVNAVTLKLDGESMKILMNANEIFRETIVNMGIKLASQTSVYRDYFKMEDLRLTGVAGGVSSDYGVVDTPSVTTTESISRVGSSLGNTYSNTEAEPKSPTTKKKPPGFGSWA